MIRMKCLLLMVVLLMIPYPWAVAQEEYIFGGSKNEILNGVAVSEDDRILMTGYTASSDGTLAGRTKEGHSGWALCVDRNGNVLFSFCSRRGSQLCCGGPGCDRAGKGTEQGGRMHPMDAGRTEGV